MSKYIDMAGEFACVVDNPGDTGWFSESKEKGTPYIRIPLTVTEDGSQKDKIITWSGYLTDNAFDNTVKALAKAFPEWDGDLAQLGPNGNFSFQGLQCRIVVETEEYDGETRYKASWLNPLNGGGGGGGKPLAGDKLKGILAKFGRKSIALANAARAESGAGAAPSRPPVTSAPVGGNPPPADDDIPF